MLDAMLKQTKMLSDLSQPLFNNSPIRYFSVLFKQKDKCTFLAVDHDRLERSFYDSRCHEFAQRIDSKDPEKYHNHRMVLDLYAVDSPNIKLVDEYAHYYRVFKHYKAPEEFFVVFNFASNPEMQIANHYYVNHTIEIDNFCDFIFERFVGFVKSNLLPLEQYPTEAVIKSAFQPLVIENSTEPFLCPAGKSENTVASPMIFKLTNKERAIINYTAMGMTSRQISEVMKLSNRTIENHIYNIKKKLGIKIKKEELIFYLTGKKKRYVDIFS